MKKMNTLVLAFGGVLIAMNVVLSKLLSIDLGPVLRLSLGPVPIILASLWLGPLVGGICGGLGDLIGCFIKGYSPVPLVLVGSILTGVIPWLVKKYIVHGLPTRLTGGKGMGVGIAKILVIIVINTICTTLGVSCLGLALYQGIPFGGLFLTRIPQAGIAVVAYTALVFLLYVSPVTNLVTNTVYKKKK